MSRLGDVRILVGAIALLLSVTVAGCDGGGHAVDSTAPKAAKLAGDEGAGSGEPEDDDRQEAEDQRLASGQESGTTIDDDGTFRVQLAGRANPLDDLPNVSRFEIPSALPPPPEPGADPSLNPVIEDVYPNKGRASGGEKIQIRGKNLQPYLVLFGSVPARILDAREADGSVTLTVAVPPARAGAAQVYLVVTNRDGNYAVDHYQYYN